jgi:1-acyl-sn-glycerol-3-phosphate acyltransferase
MSHSAAPPSTPLVPTEPLSTGQPRRDWTRWLPCNLFRAALQDALILPAVRAYCAPFRARAETDVTTLRGPVVIVANHASHLDTPAILAALPASIRHRTAVAAAADYFYRDRLVGAAMSLGIGAFPFPRKGRAGIEHAADLLADGWSVLLFPEGTRGSDGAVHAFRMGIGYLLADRVVPVLPVAIMGSHVLWPRGRALPRRGALEVRLGAPWLPEAGMEPRAIVEELERRVTALTTRERKARAGEPWT